MKKKLLALALAAAMTMTVVPAFAAEAEAPADQEDYVVNFGFTDTNSFVTGFDVNMSNSMVMCETGTTSLIYDAPFFFDQDGTLCSKIFESWEWLDDTHLHCVLYDDIYFSNGDQLTAEDILFTYSGILEGNFPIKFMMDFLDFDNWEISDDGLDLVIAMNTCTPACFGYLTYGILDKDYIESVGGGENIDWYDPAQVVGSGPYICTEYVQDSHSTYERRDDYWGYSHGYDVPISEWNITLYGDKTSMMADFTSGIIDFAWAINNDDYDKALAGDYGDVTVGTVSNNMIAWLVMDDDYGATADPAVREAICYAIDADAIADICYGGMALYNSGFLAVTETGYAEGFGYEYDPAYAQQVLADAGYSDGEINLVYTYKLEDSVQSTCAEMVQAYLMAIGINCELNGLDETTYSTEETVEDYSNLAFYFMSQYTADVGMTLNNWLSSGTNTVINRHGLYDELIENSNSTTNEEVRNGYFLELQQAWQDNFDCVPLFEYPIAYMYRTEDLPAGYYVSTTGGNLTAGMK